MNRKETAYAFPHTIRFSPAQVDWHIYFSAVLRSILAEMLLGLCRKGQAGDVSFALLNRGPGL